MPDHVGLALGNAQKSLPAVPASTGAGVPCSARAGSYWPGGKISLLAAAQ